MNHVAFFRLNLALLLRLSVLISAPANFSVAAEPNTSRAEASEVAVDAAQLQQALDALVRNGVIRHKAYWWEHAQTGKTCNGGLVARVILGAANRVERVDTLKEAIDLLVARGVSRHPEYWRENAQKGKTCRGASVATLLIRLQALDPGPK
jgi:hypothetical protein